MNNQGDIDSGSVQPAIIPRPEHTISRASISPSALKVLYRLKEAGFQSNLVGGGVRDLLLGREPKDFDVATNATPDEISRAVDMPLEDVKRILQLRHVPFSLDEAVGRDQDNKLSDLMLDRTTVDPADGATREMLHRRIPVVIRQHTCTP